MTTFLDLCRAAVGASHVLDTDTDMHPFLTDWRGRFHGRAQAVIRPGSTQEVMQIVRLCQQFRVPVVPQGGNTGLVAGAVPDGTARSIVLVLTRLNKIRNIDVINNTMTVEAGCILQTVQEAAAAALRLFPLSLAAEGSCTIGGNLATMPVAQRYCVTAICANFVLGWKWSLRKVRYGLVYVGCARIILVTTCVTC